MAHAADAVDTKFSPVTLLFNNAGINLFQTIEDSSYDDWDWITGVNLHGPINGVKTFAPRMIKVGKCGYIVNTVSMAALLGAGAPGIYSTTKFALHGVSVLCPGQVKSYIYASGDVHPDRLKADAKPVDRKNVQRLADIHEFSMEPFVIAARVLEAMREDRYHIFTHQEFKDELRELFDEIMADVRDYAADPGFDKRTEFKNKRGARDIAVRGWD